jgi:two-component system, sensor histidine kinase and response regulator
MNTLIPEPSRAAAIPPLKRLILIVDDLPDNLQVLAGHLMDAGYEILAANSGARALALVRNRKPDLILLDIMMPGMDGFEVCEALKADPESQQIPVIFITARTETEDIVRGLEKGAVDYVTKPFKPAELLARVRTHLELKSTRDMCVTYNQQLHRITQHTQRLNEDKNRFLSIVSHDIRGAFGNVVSVSRMLTEPSSELEGNEATRLLNDIGIEAEHMIALAQNLLNIDAIERQQIDLRRERVEVDGLQEFSLQSHQMAIRSKNLDLRVNPTDLLVAGDLTACRQIINNLLSNAVKYSPEGSVIWIEASSDRDNQVRITVRDHGPGLSAEDQKKLFIPFTRLNSKTGPTEHSVGLGLSIVKLMTQAMGGSVTCQSEAGKGASFSVALPAWPPSA